MALTGKVAVITGAGSGIGRAVAVEMARRGVHLSISDVDPVGLSETADLVALQGADVHTAAVDVSDRGAVEDYAADVVDHYGATHVVVNNAGIAGDTGPIVEEGLDIYDRVLGVNLWGVIHGSKAFLPHLIASGDGHLVNISSILGIIASPASGAYCTSKFAVRGFTEAIRADLIYSGAPVKVTVVHPGGVATEIANSALARGEANGGAVRADLVRRVDTANRKLLKMPPQRAATIIVDGIAAEKSRVLVGADARVLDSIARLFPQSAPALTAWMERRLYSDASAPEVPAERWES